MSKRAFRNPPKFWGSNEEAIRKSVLASVNDLLRGKSNNTYEVTLAVSPATTTTVPSEICTPESEVFVTPKTSTAATAVGAGVIWLEPLDGSFVVHHDSSASANRTFGVAVIG